MVTRAKDVQSDEDLLGVCRRGSFRVNGQKHHRISRWQVTQNEITWCNEKALG
jgi:hypothetical protein